MKNISLIFGGVLTIIACNAYAVTATVTSRDYVDNALATKQAKIPSAGTAGAPTGNSVITYTASSGTIGERGLYTDSTEYDATADSDKLITASALRGAFKTLPETDTTKLECTDSNCLLWNIVTQTAYGITPFNPDVSINGTSGCNRSLSGESNNDYCCGGGVCSSDTLSYLGAVGNKSGKWGVVFPYGEVSGISVCSTQSGSRYTPATSEQSSILDAEYVAQTGVGEPEGNHYCWCKMINPTGSQWVQVSTLANCGKLCTGNCVNYVRTVKNMRQVVFRAQ